MMTRRSWMRMLALVLAFVVGLTVAMPARAEALEPFLLIGLATVGAALVLLIVVAIIASIHERDMKADGEPLLVACLAAAPTCGVTPPLQRISPAERRALVRLSPAPLSNVVIPAIETP